MGASRRRPVIGARLRPVLHARKAGFSSLVEGAKVSYDVVANRGKESAENIRLS